MSVAREALRSLQDLSSQIRKVRGAQVRDRRTISLIQSAIDQYFRNTRPFILQFEVPEIHLKTLDSLMQDLLGLTHSYAAKRTYLNTLATVTENFQEIDKLLLIATPRTEQKGYSEIDQKILATLKEMLPSAALAFEQALCDLSSEQRYSWRGPATDLRESLREILDHLAPDQEVTAQQGFKLEADCKGPSMKQKVKYILKMRNANSTTISTNQASVQVIEDSIGAYVRSVYTRASVSTHTPTNKAEVERLRQHATLIFQELLSIK